MRMVKDYFLTLLKSTLVVITSYAVFASCSKDKEPEIPQQATIEGAWEGKWSYGSADPSYFYAFQVKPGGVIERRDENGNPAGAGTWSLSGNVFIAIYIKDNDQFSIAGNFNPSTGKIENGQWGYGYSTTDGGLFYLTKKN